MELTYRRVQRSDASALLDYLKIIGGESDNLTFGSEGFPATVEQEEAFLAGMNEETLMLMALEDGQIVGNASINRYGRTRFAHRWSLAVSVRKSHWGMGIGSGLMTRLIAYAKTQGAEVIELEVRSDNSRAKRLYQKFGFETFGTYRKFFKIDGRHYDADYMNLYL